MTIQTIGLDLAKHIFHVHGVDARGQVIVSRALKRAEVSLYFANLPACRVGMEACSSAYYWARTVMALGHEVRLISPQFVKPYVKSNKSDKNDAEAICEAVSRPSMRFVPVKTDEQLDILAIHRVRQRLVANKVALVNQIRGLLAERGLIIAREVASLRRRLPEILETAGNGLSDNFRALLAEQYRQLQELEEQIHGHDRRIRNIYTQHEACQRLAPGVRVVVASPMCSSTETGGGKKWADESLFSRTQGRCHQEDAAAFECAGKRVGETGRHFGCHAISLAQAGHSER